MPRGAVVVLAHPDHAETLAIRCLHHPPALDERDPGRTQRFQPRDLGVDVIGLDVEVHARGVFDLLHFDVQVAWRAPELGVLAGAAGIGIGDRDP